MMVRLIGRATWRAITQVFTKTWCNRCSRTGRVSQLILGCDKEYFIKGTGWWYWRLNDSMEKEIDIHKNCGDIDVLALGQNGSYVVQLKSGRAFLAR